MLGKNRFRKYVRAEKDIYRGISRQINQGIFFNTKLGCSPPPSLFGFKALATAYY